MKNALLIAIGAAAAAAVILLSGFIQQGTVAKVGAVDIGKDELYEKMLATSGTETLDVMISDEIVRQEAHKEGIEVAQKEIDAELAVYEESYGGEEALQAAIEASGMSVDKLTEEIKTYLLIEKLVGPEVEVTDEEIETYFEENKDTFAQAETVEASHILVETEEEANEVKAKLEEGGNFAEVAKEYSTDTASAENGGELGAFGKGEMAEEFEEAAFSMKIDEVSGPVKTEFGFHIIKVTDKTEAAEANLEDSKEQIQEVLFDQKLNTQYATWIAEKKESYDIENKLAQGGN